MGADRSNIDKLALSVELVDNDLIVDPPALVLAAMSAAGLRRYGWKAIIWCRRSTPGNAAPIGPRALSRNHVYWRGGQLAFGKVTMAVTALELVDLDTEDPFDFSVDNWNAPLVAGYSKMLPNQGLRAWMPDFADRR